MSVISVFTQEVKEEGSWIQCQLWLHNEMLSQNKTKQISPTPQKKPPMWLAFAVIQDYINTK